MLAHSGRFATCFERVERIRQDQQDVEDFGLCTTNVRFLKIFLSKFLVLLSNLFGSFEFWSFEFVSNFGFRASDLVAATPRCGLCALCERKVFEGTVDPASAAEVRMEISACSFLPVFWLSA